MLNKKSLIVIMLLSNNLIFGSRFGDWSDPSESAPGITSHRDQESFAEAMNVSKYVNTHYTVYEAMLPNNMKLTIKIDRSPGHGGTVYKGYIHPESSNDHYFRLTRLADIKLLATMCEYELHKKSINALANDIGKLKTGHSKDGLENKYNSGLSYERLHVLLSESEKEFVS